LQAEWEERLEAVRSQHAHFVGDLESEVRHAACLTSDGADGLVAAADRLAQRYLDSLPDSRREAETRLRDNWTAEARAARSASDGDPASTAARFDVRGAVPGMVGRQRSTYTASPLRGRTLTRLHCGAHRCT